MNSTKLARHTIRQLIELGISDFVLSPGSRNAPLAIALNEAHERGLVDLHIRIDERSAAFFALGVAKSTNKYVSIICTSGTAIANYYPAVLEAHHSNVKLLILSADRPARLRNTGANQTTIQKDFFFDFVRHSIDTATPIEIKKYFNETGPIHINLQFDEPLIEFDTYDWLTGIHITEPTPLITTSEELEITSDKNIIIVGQDRAGFTPQEIIDFASLLNAPLIAEDPLSFKNTIAYAPIILASGHVREKLAPDLTIVFGRTTLSRPINSYIESSKKIIVIDPRLADVDTNRSAYKKFLTIPTLKTATTTYDAWNQDWKTYETLAAKAIAELPEWSEASVIRTIAEEIPDNAGLFISSSRPIRDVESFATPRNGISTYANRGLAGIDGNISTAMGVATHHQQTTAILGDLGFLHDVSALTNPEEINLLIVVLDNNGGGIFSTLPQRGVNGFEKIFGTPHNLDIVKIATSYGIPSLEIRSITELRQEITRSATGMRVVVAKMPDRELNADFLKAVAQKYLELVAL